MNQRTFRRGVTLAITSALLASLVAVPGTLAAGSTVSTTTLDAPLLNPKPVGRTTDITATVTAGATGDVTFFAGAASQATVALSGSTATWTVPADMALGTYDITATYNGDGTYATSTSAAVQLVVGPAPALVALAVSGPHDGSGATAQKGDTLTVYANVTDNGTGGILPAPQGSVAIRVDGVTKGTITLPAQSVDISTAAWALGAHSIVAVYLPGAFTDFATAESPAWPLQLSANVVEAVGVAPTLTTFYPYKDGYKDTTGLRGVRNETASVTVKIYSSVGKLVRTLTVPSGIGKWTATWNGRNTAGSYVAAGRYTVRQTVRDALGATKTLPAVYVTVSMKRLYTYTVTLKQSVSQKDAGSLSSGWLGWKFTLPSATVYKKLVFGAYGKSGIPSGIFGPHDYALCPSTTAWNWYSCTNPYQTFAASSSWRSVTGSVTRNRHGSTVRMYAVGGYRTSVQYARVVVTYGVLR